LVAEDLSQMGRDTIASLIAGIIQRNSLTSELKPKTKEAFVDSETETDYTEVTLSPTKDLDSQPRSTIPKPLFSKSHGFHSLPHSSMKSRVSNFASWEANNLMEEMTHGSHVAFHRSLSKSAHSSTMDLDSLSVRYAEDSLNFDLQEVAEEDSLGNEDEEDLIEHDSLQPKSKPVEKKKLIIPYNESFSSTTSVFTTSQDGSLESHKNGQTEEDSLTTTQSNVTLNMVPLKPWLNNHHQASTNQPLIIGPEYQPIKSHPEVDHPGAQQQALQPRHSPAGSSSLMKLATERMKKKFLGWS